MQSAPVLTARVLFVERADRTLVSKRAQLVDRETMTALKCTVQNISDEGAGIRFEEDVSLPERFLLQIGKNDIEVECEKIWSRGHDTGVRFVGEKQPLTALRRRLFSPL